MPNLRLPVAPLTGGVSTQPADSRLPNQVETSDNTILRLQRGLEKRPGSKFVSELIYNVTVDTLDNASFTHFFSQGGKNFVAIIDGTQTGTTLINSINSPNCIQVYDLSDGARCSVEEVDASGTAAVGDAIAYLAQEPSVDGRDKLKAITYGTTTLLVNTEVEVSTTGDTTGRTTDHLGSSLPVPPEANTFASGDGWTPGAGSVSTGINVHTLNSDVGYPAGYYSVDVFGATDIDGPWYTRLEAKAVGNQLDQTTMPIRLVYTGVSGSTNSFEVSYIDYNRRLSGDETTNPAPTFAGETIQDICIFQDRLWIGHETGITSSQAGDLFNFWVDDYTNVTDSDPISLVMPGPQANQVRWLIPVSDSIVVFGSQGGQYEITTRDFFTPSSTNLQVTGSRGSEAVTRPGIINQQVAYLEDKANTSALWEYFYDFGSDSNLVVESSIQCQGYLPDEPRLLETAPNHGLAFVAPFDSTDIHVYHYYWDSSEKLQSAFTRWKFYDYSETTDAAIWGFYARDNFLWYVIRRLGKVYLERVDIGYPSITSGQVFNICLDNQISSTGVYDSATNLTTWTITDWEDTDLDSANAYRIILGSSWGDQKGTLLVPDSVTASGGSTVLTLAGQWQGQDTDDDGLPDNSLACTVGVKYTMSSKMSQPMVRDEQGQTVQGNFQIRTMEVRHEETTEYEVMVTPANRDSKTFPFYAGRVGSAKVGELARSDYGRFNVRVFGNSQDTDITIQSDGPYPVLITKLEYIGDFVPQRSNPVK